jgi:ElaB/YqjD/DUF883 family membrane-anchored ribosome-binding protein
MAVHFNDVPFLEAAEAGRAADAAAKPARSDAVARAEADLERSRARVAESVLALRDEVARRSDWRGWVRQRPWLVVGGALALGFLLGRGRGRRPVYPTHWRH